MTDEKQITLKESDVKQMLEQNRNLAFQVQGLASKIQELTGASEEHKPSLLRKGVNSHTVRVSFINDKPVIGFANRGTENRPTYIYERPDPENPKEQVLYVDILLEGESKPLQTRYLEFLREAEHRKCRILSTKEDEWENVQGMTEVKEITGDNYSPTSKGFEVPAGAVGKHHTFTVDIGDGKELAISEHFVNIS